jgi:hypothetical protein
VEESTHRAGGDQRSIDNSGNRFPLRRTSQPGNELETLAIQGVPAAFVDRRSHPDRSDEALNVELYQQIGQLQVELGWLSGSDKKPGLSPKTRDTNGFRNTRYRADAFEEC